MAVSERDVRHVAGLARIALDPAEAFALTEDLSRILEYVDRLQLVEPPDTVLELAAPKRRGDVPASFEPGAILSRAPSTESRLVVVPLGDPPPKPEPPRAPMSDSSPAEVELSVFQQLALKTGRIVTAERHPSADRLLVMSVDVGEEKPRPIVAGLATYYPDPQVLVGRTVVVVTNLKPVTLRGVRSEGMILAAGGKDHRGVVTVAGDCPPGEVVR